MNSTDDREPNAAQLSGTEPHKCLVCGAPIGASCFCKIHRKEGGPIMLCCPRCTIQYLDSARTPADIRAQELRAYESEFVRLHFSGKGIRGPG
jgi:hypothetical protein